MTRQEYLDLLIKTSREGGFPATSKALSDAGYETPCAYRGENGRKCAIGLLIPDEIYKPYFETKTPGSIWNEIQGYMPEDLTSVQAKRIQEAHDDNVASGEGWSHSGFVAILRVIPYFSGCVFPEE